MRVLAEGVKSLSSFWRTGDSLVWNVGILGCSCSM